MRLPATAPESASNTCWCRWFSVWARRSWRWSAPISAPVSIPGHCASRWPAAWLGLFSDDPGMLATGAQYLRIVGPAYGFFGLGLALYFASQGAGRLLWPLLAG